MTPTQEKLLIAVALAVIRPLGSTPSAVTEINNLLERLDAEALEAAVPPEQA